MSFGNLEMQPASRAGDDTHEKEHSAVSRQLSASDQGLFFCRADR
jgi:hypothetical protein